MTDKNTDSLIRKTAKATAKGIKTFLLGEEKKLFSEFDEVIQITKEKLDEFIERVTKRIFNVFLLLIGFGFVAYAIALFIQQEFLLEEYISFLIVGFVVIMAAWLLKDK